MLARPFVLDAIGLFHREHAASDQGDHDVRRADDFDSDAPQSGVPESAIESPIVVNRYGMSPVRCNGKRRTFPGTQANAGCQPKKKLDLARVVNGAGIEMS